MTEAIIQAKVTEIVIRQLGLKVTEISADKAFIDDLGADSLDIVEMVMTMEEEFGFEIPEEDADKIRTMGDAVSYIKAHQP